MNRRQFMKSSAIAMAANAGWPRIPPARAASPKRILVLGGTFFLGPALVEAAVVEGHEVTLFNRGMTNPELFPHVEKLRGHRSADAANEDLSALAHRHFDVAIDVWPSDPALVESAAAFLKDRVRHYLYVSSIAAYDGAALTRAGVEESAPLAAWDGPGRSYNRGKAESERRLRAMLGAKLTIVRPGPIKGTRDTTPDLLTWLLRAQSGGQHIGPGDGDDPVELVDVKDVARFLLHAVHHSLFDTFNLTGRCLKFSDFLRQCNLAVHAETQFVWIPQRFLKQQGLESDDALGLFAGNFPLWRPPGARPQLFQISSDKAFRAGWQTRPFEETAFDCLRDFKAPGWHLDWDDYLSRAKEQQVLAAWSSRRSGPAGARG